MLRRQARLPDHPALLWFTALLAFAAWSTLILASRSTPVYRLDLAPGTIAPSQGHAYATTLSLEPAFPFVVASDSNTAPRASNLRLFENGRELGPAHAVHQNIAEDGSGLLSHWGEALLFSSGDNSDPRANGRVYRIVVKANVAPAFVHALAGIGTIALLSVCILGRRRLLQRLRPVLRDRQREILVRFFAALAAAVAAAVAIATAAAPTYRYEIRPGTISKAAGHSSAAMLGSFPRYPYVVTPDTNEGPMASKLQLFEGDRRLGPAHSSETTIAKTGGGGFSYWYGGLLFSTSDNSDPKSNGRSYYVTAKADLDPLLRAAAAAMIAACFFGLHWAGGSWVRRSLHIAFGALAIGAVLLINREFYSLTHFMPFLTPDSTGYLDAIQGRRGWFMPAVFGTLHALDPGGRIFVPFQLNLLLLSFAAVALAVGRITRAPLWGWLTFFLLAFSPAVLAFALFLLSEASFIAILCCHLACALLALKQRSLAWAGVAGATAGVAILIRPVGYSLLAGLPLLALLATKRRLHIAMAATGAALGVLILANLPVWTKGKDPNNATCLALLGHVLHLTDPTRPTRYPELTARIVTKIGPMIAWQDARYPREYWSQTVNSYNLVLWGQALPEIASYVQEKRIAGDHSTTIDAVARDIALSIVLNRPLAYLRLIAAEMYGLWATQVEVKLPALPNAIESWAKQANEEFPRAHQARAYFGSRGYTILAATRDAREGKIESLWLEEIGRSADRLRTGAVLVLPALIVSLGLAFLASLARGFPIAPVPAGAAFCCGEILVYAVALGASQPALDRYGAVVLPVAMTALVLVAAGCLSTLLPRLGRLLAGSAPERGTEPRDGEPRQNHPALRRGSAPAPG